MNSLPGTLDEALHRIKGKRLTSVEFVQDYLQLRFNGATLTTYTTPSVVHEEKTTQWGDSSYRDMICSQINVQVTDTSLIQDSALAIYFENDVSFKISLEDKDYRSLEAVYFVADDGSAWTI